MQVSRLQTTAHTDVQAHLATLKPYASAPLQRAVATAAGQDQQTGSGAVPGKGAGIKSMILEAGTSLMQKFAPTKKISQHVCAFHFYVHDMTRQVGGRPLCIVRLLVRC